MLRAVRSYEAKIKPLRTTKGDFGFGSNSAAAVARHGDVNTARLCGALALGDPREIADWQNVHWASRSFSAAALACSAISFLLTR